MILTQRALIAALRQDEDLELRISTPTVHRMIAKGMPTVTAGKKPRFDLVACKAWILASREAAPVVQDARDLVFRRVMRKGA